MRDVEFRNIRKVYPNGYVAVEDLNLKVEDGEFLVLLGPSGCGKSTSLRMLAGLEDCSSGEILIGGTKINDLPPSGRDLGMVFQSYALYPHMSIEENLSFGLKMGKGSNKLSKSEIDNRVQEVAEMLELTTVLDRKPKALSGGQRQRVAIGRALIKRPKVLLMDEPLSNLDAKLRNQMRIELRKLHEKHNTTTVYVTHDQVEAMTLADRIAIMNDGILQQHDVPLAIYNNPSNPYVASFLGTPPMNLIEGTITNGEFVANDLKILLPDHLSDTPDGKYTFGIRPEHLQLSENDGFQCEVLGVEMLGGTTIFHLDAGGNSLIASSSEMSIHSNNNVSSRIQTLRASFNSPASRIFPI